VQASLSTCSMKLRPNITLRDYLLCSNLSWFDCFAIYSMPFRAGLLLIARGCNKPYYQVFLCFAFQALPLAFLVRQVFFSDLQLCRFGCWRICIRNKNVSRGFRLNNLIYELSPSPNSVFRHTARMPCVGFRFRSVPVFCRCNRVSPCVVGLVRL